MDRVNSRIAPAYGYAVCFITVIVMLIAIKSVVDAAFDLGNPIRAEGENFGRSGRPLTSFELYKMDARRQGPRVAPATDRSMSIARSPSPPLSSSADSGASDADLRRMYEAERDAAIGDARFRATRSLAGNVLLIILAAVLFGIHWRWLKARDTLAASA
jgi:hypothetical protein